MKHRSMIPWVIIIAVLTAAAFTLYSLHRPPQAVCLALLILTVLAVAVMAFALYRSLRVTLFAYRNIGLIGGILFLTLLAAAVFPGMFSALRSGALSSRQVFQAIVSFPRQFSYYALFGIAAISILLGISNVALIRHEGFRPTNALSLLLAFFYIGGTLAIYALSDFLREQVFSPLGMMEHPAFLAVYTAALTFLLLMLCYLECILFGSGVMGWLAARRTPSYDKDYIIILGCSIDRRGGLLPLLRGRVNRAIRFAWEQEIATGKPLRYVPSGGQGANEVMSEGSAMELYLLTRGAEPDEVFPEKKSATTWENMCFSKKLIDEKMPNARVAFATTNYHILRSGILARRAGLDAEGIAGDTKWYFWPNGFVREFFGILALNIKAHLAVAVSMAAACTALGIVGWYANLI